MRRSIRLELALSALVLGAGIVWAFHGRSDVEVITAPVTAGAINRRIVATGTLQPLVTVDLGTQVSGSVQTIAADYNSIVRAGQDIARLEPDAYQAQLLAAQAALARARADTLAGTEALEAARTTLMRAEQLFTQRAITQADLDAARVAAALAATDLEAEKSQVVEAEAAVHEAGLNLSHTIIGSPIDGIVVARNVDVGQTLAAVLQSPVLFSIASDLKRMQLRIDIDESDVGGVTSGERATFDVESYPDETFSGTVSEVRLQPVVEQTATATSAAASAAIGAAGTLVSYTAIVDVANPEERLRPGMTALVMLGGAQRDHVIRVPNSALSFHPPPDVLDALGEKTMLAEDAAARRADSEDDHAAQIWRYDAGRFTPVAVRTGLADDGWTEIVSGPVRAGDRLVTDAAVRRP